MKQIKKQCVNCKYCKKSYHYELDYCSVDEMWLRYAVKLCKYNWFKPNLITKIKLFLGWKYE